MSVLIPIIAAIAYAAGVILNKIILSYQKVGHRQFLVVFFFLLFLLSALLFPFFGKIDFHAFNSDYFIILMLIIFIATVYNILFYHALEKEKIIEWELIVMATPLATILIASIFLETERNLGVLIAGVISSLALIASHIRRYHISFDSFQKGLLLYLILYPFEAILIKKILHLFSPLALYMVRTLGIFVALFLWYLLIAPYFKGEPRLSLAEWKTKNYLLCLLISFLAVLQMVLIYYGYASFGIVFTTLVLTLGPILTYLASVVILKERLKKRVIIAAVVILFCIIYSYLAVNK